MSVNLVMTEEGVFLLSKPLTQSSPQSPESQHLSMSTVTVATQILPLIFLFM